MDSAPEFQLCDLELVPQPELVPLPELLLLLWKVERATVFTSRFGKDESRQQIDRIIPALPAPENMPSSV